MSFALPFARSASNELPETRLAGLGLAAIAVFLFTLAAFSPQVLGDGDTWSHVATGEWIIAHGSAPHADPFSHSMAGAPWTAHEWLSEVLLALAFRARRMERRRAHDRRRRCARGVDRRIERRA